MSLDSWHLSVALVPRLCRLNSIFRLCSFLAEWRSSFSQRLLSRSLVSVSRESLRIAIFSVCFVKYFLLHALSKAPFPLYELVFLYSFATLFHSLGLWKAISFSNHQIIFMHSNLWTIEIPHLRSREAKYPLLSSFCLWELLSVLSCPSNTISALV